MKTLKAIVCFSIFFISINANTTDISKWNYVYSRLIKRQQHLITRKKLNRLHSILVPLILAGGSCFAGNYYKKEGRGLGDIIPKPLKNTLRRTSKKIVTGYRKMIDETYTPPKKPIEINILYACYATAGVLICIALWNYLNNPDKTSAINEKVLRKFVKNWKKHKEHTPEELHEIFDNLTQAEDRYSRKNFYGTADMILEHIKDECKKHITMATSK